MHALLQSSGYTVSGIDIRHGYWLKSDPGLRTAIARWIGVSPIKAMFFFDSFFRAIAFKGNLYVVQRDQIVVGAAFMKFPVIKLFDEEIETADWSILYGIGANNMLALEALLRRVFEKNVEARIKHLHFSDRLKRNFGSMLAIGAAHGAFASSMDQPVFKLANGPAPKSLTFFK